MSTFENEFLGFDPSQLDVLNQPEKPSGNGNPLIYKMRPVDVKSEDHIYRATIKIVYNPFAPKQSVLEQQSYALQDKDGWLTVVSKLTNNDTSCPIFKAWKKCHYADKDTNRTLWLQAATKEDDKEGRALFDKRYGRYVLIQVLEDENQPDKVGKFLFWKCPRAIWDLVDSKIRPKDPKKAKVPVMDYFFGRSIEVTVTPGPGNPGDERYSRETKYAGELSYKPVCCINPDGSPLLNDEEQAVLKAYTDAMEDVWNSRVPEERTALEAQIRQDPNTVELGKIYNKYLPQIKQWAPNLIEELGYKEWAPEVATRVQKWIDIVLQGNIPADAANVPTAATTQTSENNEEGKQTVTSAPAAPVTSTVGSEDSTDDLPF